MNFAANLQLAAKWKNKCVLNNTILLHAYSVQCLHVVATFVSKHKCDTDIIAVMMYKIVNHLIDIPASSCLLSAPTDHATRGHNMRFVQPMKKINSYLYSFFPQQ